MRSRNPGCFIAPNGMILFAICISSLVALLLSLISAFTCIFVKRTELTSNFKQTYDLGLWSWGMFTDPAQSYYSDCYRYGSDDPVDGILDFARLNGVLAIIFGGLVLVITWVSVCIPFSETMMVMLGIGYFLTSTCEGSKLFILDAGVCKTSINDYEWEDCELGSGAEICIATVCLWFLGGVISLIAAYLMRNSYQ